METDTREFLRKMFGDVVDDVVTEHYIIDDKIVFTVKLCGKMVNRAVSITRYRGNEEAITDLVFVSIGHELLDSFRCSDVDYSKVLLLDEIVKSSKGLYCKEEK